MSASARPPKMAEVIGEDQLLNWLAETIQAKVTKENAGFVQIEVVRRGMNVTPHLTITNPSGYKHTLVVSTERVRPGR